jgi:hypothetical protein
MLTASNGMRTRLPELEISDTQARSPGGDARGILVHLNNLENLSDADAVRAGAVFRDLRDPCLLADG